MFFELYYNPFHYLIFLTVPKSVHISNFDQILELELINFLNVYNLKEGIF